MDLKKKLTKAQVKELRSALSGLGFDRESIVTIEHSKNVFDIWRAYQAKKSINLYLGLQNSVVLDFSKVLSFEDAVNAVLPGSGGQLKKKVNKAVSSIDVEQSSKNDVVEQSQEPKIRRRGLGKKPSKVNVSFAIDPSDYQALVDLAEKEDRAVSSLFRIAVKQYLERQS